MYMHTKDVLQAIVVQCGPLKMVPRIICSLIWITIQFLDNPIVQYVLKKVSA